mgnify:CR=1 FL=1
MNGTVQNLKEAWQKMPGKTKKMIAVIAAGTIILAAAGLLVLNIGTKKGYSTLFTGMSSDDAQAVVSLLQDEGVDYRYNDKNGSVQVMSDTVDKTRAELLSKVYGDNVIEKHGINRDSTGDREKTRYLCGKQGIFTRDRALIRPGFIRQLETRASTRSASFFHALGSPGRPHNGGGEAGAYRTRNGAKPLKQGHLRAKRGPLGPSRKSQQQTKRTGFAAHGHSIAETAPEGKRASCANGALIRA